jgi:hypothetical protein
VNGVSSITPPILPIGVAGVVTSAPPPASLLPPPAPLAAEQLGDAMAMLYATMAKQRDAQAADGKLAAESTLAEKHRAIDEMQKKLQEKIDAANNPFGWLMDLFKAIAMAASAIVSVCTCGAASGILAGTAIAISAASMVMEKTGALEGLSPELGAILGGAAKILGAVLSMNVVGLVGESVQTTGAVMSLAGKATGEEWATYVGMGASMAGGVTSGIGALGSASGGTTVLEGLVKGDADTLRTVENTLSRGASLVSFGAQVGGGISDIGAGLEEHDRLEAEAGVVGARARAQRLQRLVDTLIAGMKETQESHQRATKSLQGAMETCSQTAVLVTAGVRG